MAHWRCARRPLTSLPVSLTFSLARSSVRLAPSFSVSSFNRSFLPNSLLSLSLYCSFCVAIPPRRLLPSAPAYPRVVVTTRVNPPPPTYTHTTRAQKSDPTIGSLHTLCLLVWFRPRPPPFPPSVPSDPRRRSTPRSSRGRCFLPLSLSLDFSLPLGCSIPSPPRRRRSLLRPAFIPQQNLHDSTWVDDKRNRALSALQPPTFPPLKVMP